MDLLSEIQGELKVNHRVMYTPDEEHSPEALQNAVLALGAAENNYINGVRTAREGMLEAMEQGGGVSDERKQEWEKALSVFDTDKSGRNQIIPNILQTFIFETSTRTSTKLLYPALESHWTKKTSKTTGRTWQTTKVSLRSKTSWNTLKLSSLPATQRNRSW